MASPAGWLAEPQSHPAQSLSLTFGNPLARVTAVFFPKTSPEPPGLLIPAQSVPLTPNTFCSSPCFPSAAGKSCSSFKGQFLRHLLCEPPQHSVLPAQGWAVPLQPPQCCLRPSEQACIYDIAGVSIYLYFLSLWSPFPMSFTLSFASPGFYYFKSSWRGAGYNP